MKEHLESIQAMHKITLSDLKAEHENEVRAREVKKEMWKKISPFLAIWKKSISKKSKRKISYNAEQKIPQ